MRRLAAILSLAAIAACAQPDPRVADLVRAGEVRFGMFSTQYNGVVNGVPQGSRPEIARALVEKIGTKIRYVLRDGPPDIIECLKADECDVVILHRDERSEGVADFSHAILQYEFTMLVRDDSKLRNVSEVDRPNTRIVAVAGHAAANVAKARMKQATVEFVGNESAAISALRSGKADAIAQTRHSLTRMSRSLTGARVLAGNYGMNINRFAVQKGRTDRRGFINDFVEAAKASGLLQQIVDRDKGSAFEVSPPDAKP